MSKQTVFGYARVSTNDQDNELQRQALLDAGATRIFEEKASGKRWDRPELQNMIDHLQPGNVVLVWKLDRLSRSLGDTIKILEQIDAKGATFKSLTQAIDTSGPAGRMFVGMLAVFGQYERELIVERTKAGVKAARDKGTVFGRAKRLTEEQEKHALEMVNDGKTQSDVARLLGVHRSIVSRLVSKHRQSSTLQNNRNSV